MKRLLWFFFFGLVPFVLAQSAPVSLVKPRFLTLSDKVPSGSSLIPPIPLADARQKKIRSTETILPPDPGTMTLFSDPDLFETIKADKKKEREFQHFYWHQAEALDYCHYRDLQGDHWYGWVDGDHFDYVLWRGNRFWWRDPFADHWLYYYRGVWWRADGQDALTLQGCVGGEYYLCDRTGKVLKDMGADGQGLIVSAPGVYQIDLRRERWAKRRMQEGEHPEKEGGHMDHSGENEGSQGSGAPGDPGTKP